MQDTQPGEAPPADGVALLREEQRAFRMVVLQVAGTALMVLGPVFALSEWSSQTATHNAILLSFVPIGLLTITLARSHRQRAAVAVFTLGVIPVIAWVHLFSARGAMAVMYFVPVLVMGMVASELSAARVVPVVLVCAGILVRIARWTLGIDTDWGEWLTHSFDAVAVIALTGLMVWMGLRRVARNETILSGALADRERHARAARDASDAKSGFLARVSHELRTPLNAILGYTELLDEERAVTPEFSEDLGRVHSSAEQLLALIDAVLDLSKVEAGRLELDVAEVEVPALIESVRATTAPLLKRNANTLVIDHAGPVWVELDGPRVGQVLLNLLSNAARFTQNGTITLRTRSEPGSLVFEVEDTGIGIPSNRMGVLFQPFVQLSASTAHEFGGTGLGLTLCDRFVRRMGGHIEVESEVGAGSLFRVVLPIQELAAS